MKKSIFGLLIILESLLLAVTGIYALLTDHPTWRVFLITAAGALLLGMLCKYWGDRGTDNHLTRADSFLVVALSWVIFSFIGMIPYMLIEDMDLSSAFFETMSGFTTTGATTIDQVDQVAKPLLFWRSLTHWIGGLGIVVFSVALIPSYDIRKSNIVSAEVTGLGLDKLRPKIGSTARRLLIIYTMLTALCAFFYWIGPMDSFDAVCHSMSTIATGGFSTHSASMGYFQSAYLEMVAAIFMISACVNFHLYYYLSIGRPRALLRNEELRGLLYTILGSTFLFTLLFRWGPYQLGGLVPHDLANQTRTALFHTCTIISTTGFAGQHFDFVAWGPIFWLLSIPLMLIGGCAGNTAGGIKAIRVFIGFKAIKNEFIRMLHPRAVLNVRMNGRTVDNDLVRLTLSFIMLFMVIVLIAVALLTLLGSDVETAFGTTISMLSNVGPGTGKLGPSATFSAVPAVSKWIMSFLMLVGRLELFTVLFLFMPKYWKERK